MTLPVDDYLATITAASADQGVVVVAPPGTEKSTRVPPALARPEAGQVLVLQPRRLAARMLAARVAREQGCTLGEGVGYEVRFDRQSSTKTNIVYMTTGVFLRRLSRDRDLEGVGAVVIDEFHERSMEADLSLALLARLRWERRAPLAVAVMSATLDPTPVADFLGGAEIVRIDTPLHPVRYHYHPGHRDWRLEKRVASGVRQVLRERGEGNVLVFLPGRAEIEAAAEAIREPARAAGLAIAPLHGSLPVAEQDFAVSSDKPRIILATNVAETSLTIDNIVAVVDSGLARVARHSPWTGLSELAVEPISQASADQRAGRAGRTGPGVCVRLFERGEFLARPRQMSPEVARSDLSSALLSLAALGATDLDWFESPPPAAVDAASELLHRLGLLEDSGITERGRRALALPTHPRLAEVVLAGMELGVGPEAAAAAAAIDAGPLVRSDAFVTSDSDIALEAEWVQSARPPRGVDARAHREARRIYRQLLRAAPVSGEAKAGDERALLLSIATGFPDRVIRRRRPGEPELIAPGAGRARMGKSSSVVDAELMVAVDATTLGAAGGQRLEVRRASAVDLEILLEIDAARLVDAEEITVDDSGRVVERRQLTWDGLVVDSSAPTTPAPERALDVLLAQVDAPVWQHCGDADRVEQLRLRLAALGHDELLSDANLDRLFREAAHGSTRMSDLSDLRLSPLVEHSLDSDMRAALLRDAPEHVSLPGRRRVPVHYESDRPPWIQSRLQDFFGLAELPRIAGESVVAHLLAPNRRAVQVTRDLASFWATHYPELRRQLMRRYPKHAWPEDPR